MAGNIQGRQHTVSLEQFVDDIRWCATPGEIKEPIDARQEEEPGYNQARRRLILRMLDPDGTQAFDRFVEVADAVEITPTDGNPESLVVSTCEVLDDTITGAIEVHTVNESGHIPNIDPFRMPLGYFVKTPGLYAEDFYESPVREQIPLQAEVTEAQGELLPGYAPEEWPPARFR